MKQGPRKTIRLPGYDYSRPGAYFVTTCTIGREPLFWREVPVVGQGLYPCLSSAGTIAREELEQLPIRFPSVVIEQYVIMSDHIHLLLTLRQGQSPCPTLGDVVGAYKSIVTKGINRLYGTPGTKIFQRRYYEHVIRNEEDFLSTWQYIQSNPARWREKYREP